MTYLCIIITTTYTYTRCHGFQYLHYDLRVIDFQMTQNDRYKMSCSLVRSPIKHNVFLSDVFVLNNYMLSFTGFNLSLIHLVILRLGVLADTTCGYKRLYWLAISEANIQPRNHLLWALNITKHFLLLKITRFIKNMNDKILPVVINRIGFLIQMEHTIIMSTNFSGYFQVRVD